LCAIPLPIVDSGHASSAGSSLCLTCGMCCRGVLNPTALLDEDELDRAAALGVRTLKKDDGHDAFHLPCPHHEHEANACTIYEDWFQVCRRYECDLLSALSKDEIPLDEALRIARATRAIEERIYELIGGRNPSQVIWYQAVAFRAEWDRGSGRVGDGARRDPRQPADALVPVQPALRGAVAQAAQRRARWCGRKLIGLRAIGSDGHLVCVRLEPLETGGSWPRSLPEL
jgi:Fe-S-cluster containining protein